MLTLLVMEIRESLYLDTYSRLREMQLVIEFLCNQVLHFQAPRLSMLLQLKILEKHYGRMELSMNLEYLKAKLLSIVITKVQSSW